MTRESLLTPYLAKFFASTSMGGNSVESPGRGLHLVAIVIVEEDRAGDVCFFKLLLVGADGQDHQVLILEVIGEPLGSDEGGFAVPWPPQVAAEAAAG